MDNKASQKNDLLFRNSTGHELLLNFKASNYLQSDQTSEEGNCASSVNNKAKALESKLQKYQLIFNQKKCKQQQKIIQRDQQTNVRQISSLHRLKMPNSTEKLSQKQLLKKRFIFGIDRPTRAQQILRASATIGRKLEHLTHNLQPSKHLSKKQFMKSSLQNTIASSKQHPDVGTIHFRNADPNTPREYFTKFQHFFPDEKDEKKIFKTSQIEKNNAADGASVKNTQEKNNYRSDPLNYQGKNILISTPIILSPRNKQSEKISKLQTEKTQNHTKKMILNSSIKQIIMPLKLSQTPKVQKCSDKLIQKSSLTFQPKLKTFKTLDQCWSYQKKRSSEDMQSKKSLNQFITSRMLGKGRFGEVFLCIDRPTGFIIAVKKMSKQKIQSNNLQNQIMNQVKIHLRMQHQNIVQMYEFSSDKNDIYLILQYLNGGTLFDYLNEMQTLPLKEAVQYLRQIIDAVTYLHDHCIVHRDIKPENIVLCQGLAKLCDFGWSAVVDEPRKTFCGTQDYVCPEILERKQYGMAVDVWCIGMLTYELLAGKMPFQGSRNEVIDKITNVDKNILQYPSSFPIQAIQFVEALLQKNPESRPKCKDLKKFKLFQMYPFKSSRNG